MSLRRNCNDTRSCTNVNAGKEHWFWYDPWSAAEFSSIATATAVASASHFNCRQYKSTMTSFPSHTTIVSGYIALPVRSAVLKPVNGGLVVRWVTTGESPLLYVFIFWYTMRTLQCFLFFPAGYHYFASTARRCYRRIRRIGFSHRPFGQSNLPVKPLVVASAANSS
jgi:hypothetical protein